MERGRSGKRKGKGENAVSKAKTDDSYVSQRDKPNMLLGSTISEIRGGGAKTQSSSDSGGIQH